jgi:hypothetical protein
MTLDLTMKTDDQINALIKNHEDKNARDRPLYPLLLAQRARRMQAKCPLNFDKSMALLRDAAVKQVCVSYGQIAEASGVQWSVARHQMNGPKGHLDGLLDLCHCHGLPMLPAICVNKTNIRTGELDPTALTGFTDGARRLGHSISDPKAYHRARQEECFEWGRAPVIL